MCPTRGGRLGYSRLLSTNLLKKKTLNGLQLVMTYSRYVVADKALNVTYPVVRHHSRNMKALFILIFCLVFHTSFCQDGKFQLSYFTTWDYSNIQKNDKNVNFEHRGKLAFGLGIQANYELSNKIELLVGASYLDKGLTWVIAPAPDSVQGFCDEGCGDGGPENWWMAYFSMPIQLQYNLGTKGGLDYYIAVGITNDWNFDGNGGLFVYKDYANSFIANFGIMTTVGKARIGIEPTFRRFMNIYGTPNGPAPWEKRPNYKPYSIGIKLRITRNKTDV